MSETALDQQITALARDLGRATLGRELTGDELEPMAAILHAAADALRGGHGFLQRLAERVQEERTTENVEEFFEDIIKPD